MNNVLEYLRFEKIVDTAKLKEVIDMLYSINVRKSTRGSTYGNTFVRMRTKVMMRTMMVQVMKTVRYQPSQ